MYYEAPRKKLKMLLPYKDLKIVELLNLFIKMKSPWKLSEQPRIVLKHKYLLKKKPLKDLNLIYDIIWQRIKRCSQKKSSKNKENS